MSNREVFELIALLKELDDDLVRCMRCGMCQAVCPLYKETLVETDVARGKLVLTYHLLNKLLEDPYGLKKTIERCLLCGSCGANCPSGVDVLKIFLKTRVAITKYLGLSLSKKIIFREIISKPNVFNFFAKVSAKLQTPFLKKKNETLNSYSFRVPISFFKKRHIIPLANETAHKKIGFRDDPLKKNNLKAGLFIGCLIDKFFPNVAESVLSVLEHYNVGIYLPQNQICCGIPILSAGDLASFKKLVYEFLKVYPRGKFNYLITPCATCASTIKKIWPIFADEFDKEIKEHLIYVSSITEDINEFLARKIQLSSNRHYKATSKKRITYHDPCHLKKGLGIFEEPREVIRSCSEYELVEMEKADMCCGMGGSFNLSYYEISKKIGEKKAKIIIDTQAEIVATSCPACMMQLIDVLSQLNARVVVKHTVEILETSIKKG